MIQDVFVPTKIGSYYIFTKRILGFEITTSSVQASLLYFSKNKVILENSMHIFLPDQNPTTLSNAIKKIASTIGKYDQVVTSLTSSAVIFKELTLPFIGREKISMIVNYEVEPLLPFPLEEAVIDFLIVDENVHKIQTTILVAAARKQDLDAYINYFEKAGIALDCVTLDTFALYDFYRYTMYVPSAYTSLLLVDFGMDSIRILYIQRGLLKSVRLVPYGLINMMSKIDDSLQDLSQNGIEELLDEVQSHHDDERKRAMAQQITVDFSKQIILSLSFFQKQIKNFMAPVKIICLGAGTKLQGFIDHAAQACQLPVEILDIKRIALKNNITINKKIKMDLAQNTSLIIPLSIADDANINFLSAQRDKLQSSLLNKQLLTMVVVCVITLFSCYFYSNYQLAQWDKAYNKSRKEMLTVLKDQMNMDLKNIKRVSEIVAAAQSELQQTKKVCSSFSQSNNAFLHHLQELCTSIDKNSLGLDLKKISFYDKEIVLQGKVKDFDALTTFKEELMGLQSFTLKNIPAELAFNITLIIKQDHDTHEESV